MYKWVNEIIQIPEAALKKVDVDIGDVIAEKGVHYGSGIAYISAKVENEDGDKQKYDFVIKYGLTEANIRQKIPMDSLFEREIQVYTKLLPRYQKLQKQYHLKPFCFTPKCFKCEISEEQEVIIMEDLRKAGFELLAGKAKTMNLNHIKLVLTCYGKWHASSFALKDQYSDEYEELVGTWKKSNPFKKLMGSHIGDWINVAHKILQDIMVETDETELLNKYKEKINHVDPKTYFEELFEGHIEKSVVVHGDSSKNNFLFKYEESDTPKSTPIKVKIVDFQASHLSSPVFDLSFFIYTVASENELEFLREQLECYYTSFASHLTQLGSCPRKLFDFADLAQHWHQYSAVGALLHPFVLAFALSSEEQSPDVTKEEDFEQKCLEVSKSEEYRNRAMAVARSFVGFEFM